LLVQRTYGAITAWLNAGTAGPGHCVEPLAVGLGVLSGFALRPDEDCSVIVSSANHQRILVDEAVVRWVRPNESGTEIRTLASLARARVENYVKRLVDECAEAIQ
jgi:hypothetical protein